MDSENETPELSSAFERFLRHTDFSLFLPFILGFTSTDGGNQDQEEPPQTAAANPRERIILINPLTQGMVVIEGTANLDSLLRDLGSKNGQPPASKASVEAMPSIEIKELGGDNKDSECVICLEEWEIGGLAKEMPCKHKFHGDCIERWLGIHGSCPVCRYKMPVDEVELGKKTVDDEQGGEGRDIRRFSREILVSFSINGNRRSQDSDQTPPTQDSNDSVPSSPTLDQETEG